MELEKITANIPSKVSTSNSCICSACHGGGKVIQLKLPRTYYRDGFSLTTNYSNYCLCRECRDKLVKSLEWGEEDGK